MPAPRPATFNNPNVPVINDPLSQIDALTVVTGQLKEGVESLGGRRGLPLDRAATLRDLVLLGLVTEVHVLNVLHR